MIELLDWKTGPGDQNAMPSRMHVTHAKPYDEALLSRAGDDQHASQDILPQAGCSCASWLCSPEGVLGSEDLRKARQIQDWPYLNYRQ